MIALSILGDLLAFDLNETYRNISPILIGIGSIIYVFGSAEILCIYCFH